MINYNTTLYEFDPVLEIFNKSNYQTDIEISNFFPDRIRIEKRKIEYLNCEIILTGFNGTRWNVITGLKAAKSEPGYFVGNKFLYSQSGKKTEMLLIHINGLAGKLHIYHFPNFDTRTANQRMKTAKDFISFINKKIGQP